MYLITFHHCIAPSILYLSVHFLNANWPQAARGKSYSVVQCETAFLGQVAALRVTRHFWHVVRCPAAAGAAAAEHLCSQRLPVRISAVQLLCSSQLTKTGTSWKEVELSGPLCSISHSHAHIPSVLLSLAGVLCRLIVWTKGFHIHSLSSKVLKMHTTVDVQYFFHVTLQICSHMANKSWPIDVDCYKLLHRAPAQGCQVC